MAQVLEDLSRHHADDEANASPCRVLDRERGVFVDAEWRHVVVGDLVLVKAGRGGAMDEKRERRRERNVVLRRKQRLPHARMTRGMCEERLLHAHTTLAPSHRVTAGGVGGGPLARSRFSDDTNTRALALVGRH